jgi:hypothetical protein
MKNKNRLDKYTKGAVVVFSSLLGVSESDELKKINISSCGTVTVKQGKTREERIGVVFLKNDVSQSVKKCDEVFAKVEKNMGNILKKNVTHTY